MGMWKGDEKRVKATDFLRYRGRAKKAINILNPVVKKVKKHSNNDKRIHKLAYVDTTINDK